MNPRMCRPVVRTSVLAALAVAAACKAQSDQAAVDRADLRSQQTAGGDADLQSRQTAGGGADLPVELGVTSSLDKVYFTEPREFDGVLGGSARVELARNEYEATQIVVFATGAVEGLTLTATDLVREGATQRLPSTAIDIRTIGYVDQLTPKVAGDRVGWIPDPLLPNQAVDLEAGALQPFLVTVFADPDLAAGDYRGRILVTGSVPGTGMLESRALPLEVSVWDFEVPSSGCMKTSALAGWNMVGAMWPGRRFTNEDRLDRMRVVADLGFRNRLAPTAVLANGLRSWNWKGDGNTTMGFPTHDGTTFNAARTGELVDYMLEKGANHFFIALTSNIYEIPAKARARERALERYLTDYRAYLASRGLLDMAYVYGVDEPWGDVVRQARKVHAFVKGVAPDVAFLQNTNQNNDRILGELLGSFDAIDINLGWYEAVDLAGYRDRHPSAFTDVWWNVNIWPAVHPNLLLEFPLVDARIIGPMSYKHRVFGFEYWTLFSETGMGNYHPVAADELRVDWHVDQRSLDGTLIYPGADQAIHSSLRYESFRDGVEDAEYLCLLEGRDPTHPLLAVETVSGIDSYATDPDDILDFRRRIAEALQP